MQDEFDAGGLGGDFLRQVIDGRAKTDGSAQFTMDVKLPGMLTALIARPPAKPLIQPDRSPSSNAPAAKPSVTA